MVVDNFWQTEIAAPVLGTLPTFEARPGKVGKPLPGVAADIVDKDGKSLPDGQGGLLVLRRPVPYMLRTVWGDPARYEKYWETIPGLLHVRRHRRARPRRLLRRPRALGRRHERRGPPHRHGRRRGLAPAPPGRRRERGRRAPGRAQGRAHQGIRRPQGERAVRARAHRQPQGPRAPGPRPHRRAARHRPRRVAPEDAVGQDRAAVPARRRRWARIRATSRRWPTDPDGGSRARELIERAPIGIYRTTREGRFLYANAAYARMLGYSSLEEVLALDVPTQVYFDPAARGRILDGVPAPRRAPRVRSPPASGRTAPPSGCASTWPGPRARGRARMEMEGFVDRHLRAKRGEEELRKLSRAVEHSPASVVITDLKGNIEYVNPAFTRVTGYWARGGDRPEPADPQVGRVASSDLRRALWEAITHGREWHGEFHNRRKDGTLYWEFASISPVVDARGTHDALHRGQGGHHRPQASAEAALAKSELYSARSSSTRSTSRRSSRPTARSLFASRFRRAHPRDPPGGRQGPERLRPHPQEDADQVKERIAGVLARGARFEHGRVPRAATRTERGGRCPRSASPSRPRRESRASSSTRETSPNGRSSRRSCASPRRWRRSGGSRAASRTTSTIS